jgi:MazG family protein
MKPPTQNTQQLLEIVRRLRAECPWDKKQTHRSLLPYLLEESYEALEALQAGDVTSMREELGDLLLQIALHSEIASEKGWFTFEEVAKAIGEKMVRRHPHVFEKERTGSKKQHSQRWTELKQKEKPKRSLLEGTPKSMPSLQLSQRYGEITSSVGFDWPDAKGVLKKLDEEAKELKAELKLGKRNKKRIAEELGDLLFTIANLARHLGINAEESAKAAARKFATRFETIETEAKSKGVRLASLSPKEWEKHWQNAKRKRTVR